MLSLRHLRAPLASLQLSLWLSVLSCAPDPSKLPGPTGLETPPETPKEGPAIHVRVRNSDGLELLPSRLIITPVAPTLWPDLHNDGATARMLTPDVLGITDGAILVGGEGTLPIREGTYDILVTQGPEFEQVRQQVTVAGKAIAELDVVLQHSVRTDGWLAADMHIHTSRSFDSKLAPAHRVISEVGAGIEVMVPTDHIWHHDLQSYVAALGYSERAVSIPGSEYGFLSGHLGVYPVQVDPAGKLWGAPDWQVWENWRNLPGNVVFPLIHSLPGQPVAVVNHPRLLPDLGYFTNIGWPHYPGEPLDTAGQFEGLEVLNGYDAWPGGAQSLLRDWFFLLSGGYRVTAIGSSDTHRMDWLTSGYPRTWLKLSTDVPSYVLPGDLRDAVANNRAVASTGPWLQLLVDGADVGSTITPQGDSVQVKIIADAASWIDLSRVQLYHNGALIKEWAVTARTHPALVVEATVPVSGDGWLVAMASGDAPLPTAVIGNVLSGRVKPLAVTNAVRIDKDGDGKVQPPPLAGQPQPFGFASAMLAPEPEPPVDRNLHVPLDCEPDAYLEWLQRHQLVP